MSHFASIYDERDAFFGILQVLIFPVLLFEAQTALKDKKASLLLFDFSSFQNLFCNKQKQKMCKIRMLYKHLEFRPSSF